MSTGSPEDRRLSAARRTWTNTGDARPPFADPVGDGQESVWDYPRPPAIVEDQRVVEVADPATGVIARTTQAVRILETASPPTFYLPWADVDRSRLVVAPGTSFCEWKGSARYFALRSAPGEVIGWDYPEPTSTYAALADRVSFYPGRVACTVDGERVRPQAGGFYGGWVTDEVVGPFKGDPGTSGW
ncbi:MAG: DUF427 domain-containing protein [Acidimicrobiales bacterium]